MNVNETNLFQFFFYLFHLLLKVNLGEGGANNNKKKINEVTQTDRETVGGNNNKKKIHEIRNPDFF